MHLKLTSLHFKDYFFYTMPTKTFSKKLWSIIFFEYYLLDKEVPNFSLPENVVQ